MFQIVECVDLGSTFWRYENPKRLNSQKTKTIFRIIINIIRMESFSFLKDLAMFFGSVKIGELQTCERNQ